MTDPSEEPDNTERIPLLDYYLSVAGQVMPSIPGTPPDDLKVTGTNKFGFPILTSESQKTSIQMIIFEIGVTEPEKPNQ